MPIRLHVSEHVVSVEGPNGERDSTRALVALGSEAGRIGIVGVGEDEPELLARLREKQKQPVRGLGARIIAAADDGSERKPLTVVRPFDDAYWDRAWRDLYALRRAEFGHDHEILLIPPLASDTFSPHLVQGLLMYALWTSSVTGRRVWPAFRRPKLELVADPALGQLEYEELVDQLWLLWGKRRVILPADRPVAPPPETRSARIARAAHVVFWLALVASVALSGRFQGSPAAIVAALIAVAAWLARRTLIARSRAERPRRAPANP